MFHTTFLLSTANSLDNFHTVTSLQNSRGMSLARHNLHVDSNSGALPIGYTQIFKQTTNRTGFWNGALIAINEYINHMSQPMKNKKAVTPGVRL
jgi:hypothetical protein